MDVQESLSIHSIVEQLKHERARKISLEQRINLCRSSLRGVIAATPDWIEQASSAKGHPGNSAVMAEDLLSGPSVVARELQLTIQTLEALHAGLTPRLPGKVHRLHNQQLSVPVFPTSGLFDRLTFGGLSASVRMQPGVEGSDLHGSLISQARGDNQSNRDAGRIAVILGAGNVSSIPATDSLHKIMFEGRRVILKMNPVNEYLTPIFERAFQPLIDANLLRIVKGGADIGRELIQHADVDEIHITGSSATHDAIVWGANAMAQKSNKQNNTPLTPKTVTSELGNVSPWIIVPGQYSTRQLKSQAQHVAASIANNASFNCLATKMIVTWKQWPQRDEFLKLIQQSLAKTPTRAAYYPGAADRFTRFSNTATSPDDNNRLPWTLLVDQSIDERPELFKEESFVCVCAETALQADSPSQFVDAATEFVNERMFGSLCASVTFPRSFRKQHIDAARRCVDNLRYGSVCINQWSGLAYGLTSPPWGAYPGATLHNIDSGIGSVHNTYLLDNFEKTVLQGPLINLPKPVWFPSHRTALSVAKNLLALYEKPSVLRLPKLFAAALLG